MVSPTLKKQLYEKIGRLSDQQLREVVIFIEFLTAREDEEFIQYVNERTKQALNNRKNGKKFYSLEELQREFPET